MSKITEKITELATPVIEKNDCELWGVEYVKEAGAMFLRVFIDRPGVVSINHCEAISRELDPVLDMYEDLIPDSYTFEVSSTGVERQLRGPQDFERFNGHFVEVKLYKAKAFDNKSGQKIYQGNLKFWDNTKLELDIDNESYVFENNEVASVRLRLR